MPVIICTVHVPMRVTTHHVEHLQWPQKKKLIKFFSQGITIAINTLHVIFRRIELMIFIVGFLTANVWMLFLTTIATPCFQVWLMTTSHLTTLETLIIPTPCSSLTLPIPPMTSSTFSCWGLTQALEEGLSSSFQTNLTFVTVSGITSRPRPSSTCPPYCLPHSGTVLSWTIQIYLRSNNNAIW